MGFFSSIGGFLKDTAGSIISAGSNLVGGLLGNSSASSINQSNQNFAREQFEYQKALHQNQLQWRVEDAKKAGLHPLAGIGIQAPSFSPVSASTTPLDYSWIGDLGQSANYGATKAKDRKQQAQMLDLQMRGLELDNEYKQAQIDALKVDTLASSIASNQAFSSPPAPKLNQKEATGLPTAPEKQGYVGEPEVQFNPTAHDPNVFTMNAGNDVTGLWEDKDIAGIIPLDLWPIIKANFIDYGSRLRGKIVNGMVYSNARNGWVSVNGPYGKEALADRLGISNLVKPVRRLLNPRGRERFDPSEYARQFYTN